MQRPAARRHHRTSIPRTALAACLLLAFAVDAWAGRTYYLSPDGSDDANGTRNAPWRSLDHANAQLEPGDTLILAPGQHTGTINPHRSGEPDAPITYRAAEPHRAKLAPGDDRFAIRLEDKHHIVIEDLTIDPGGEGGWMFAERASHITVRGCRMFHAEPIMKIIRSSQIRLIDNYFNKHQTYGDMIRFRFSEHILIEGNTITRVGHCPLLISNCRNVVVRGNVFRNDWGRNYEFWATGRILVEGNIMTQVRDSARSADTRAKNLYHDGIFRFNRVFDNRHTPLNSPSYIPTSGHPTSQYREPFRLVNSRIYNNTIADNLGHGWQIYGLNISSNLFQNNIFYRNDWAGGQVQFLRNADISRDNRIWSNLFRGNAPGEAIIRYRNEHYTIDELEETIDKHAGGYWTEYAHNIDGNPAFTDPDSFDYTIQSHSDAVDAGRPLALAWGDGTSDMMPVTDGVPFYDGFGIEGEKGDWIMVGPEKQLARIERIELRYYLPHRLHLDREVSFSEGDPVNLPWHGEAPDIGAYELELVNPGRVQARAYPAQPNPGDEVQFTVQVPDETIRSVRWRFDDGTWSDQREPVRTFDAIGDYAATVRVTLENGDELVDGAFVKVRDGQRADRPLVEIDFDPATYRDTWGYHFKFYRAWLSGYELVDRVDGQGQKMHLFYDANKRNEAAGAISPGQWHIDTHPYIRFAYRIEPGTPVALAVRPFDAPHLPHGVVLGGTEHRNTGRFSDLDAYELHDDDQWHTITIDLRHIREQYPEFEYAYRFKFFTDWEEDRGAFWFDDFTILPADASNE